MMGAEDFPVLICGAGPTGLTMANLLARFNIPFLLVDKKPHPSKDSKAFGIQVRTLEIFSQLGIAEKAIEEGNIKNTLHFNIQGKEAAKVEFTEILPGEAKYPYFLILPQDKTESVLIHSLQQSGGEVLWQHELINFEEKNQFIIATLKEPAGEEIKYKIKYLLGCDGAGSFVRVHSGIPFEGKTFSPVFYLADCELEWDFSHGDIYFILGSKHLSGIFSYRKKNQYRLFSFLNTSINKKEGMLSEEEVQKIVDSGPIKNIKVKNVRWTSCFHIHSRLAKFFRRNNLFLLGDAAHVHSPAGGQGMNTGIQDAYNLAWKLSLVLNGLAKPELLDSYQKERFEIAKNLHKTTDRVFHWMVKSNLIAEFYRLYIFPYFFKWLMGIKFFRKKFLRRGSQIAIKYPDSPLSREGNLNGFNKKAPKAGDRAPFVKVNLDGKGSDIFDLFKCTHFTLLIAVSESGNKKVDMIREYFFKSSLPVNIHTFSLSQESAAFFKVYGIKKEALFIVRPDGYIGFRSSVIDIKGVEDYFKEKILISEGSTKIKLKPAIH